jgi:hypothetical protein
VTTFKCVCGGGGEREREKERESHIVQERTLRVGDDAYSERERTIVFVMPYTT